MKIDYQTRMNRILDEELVSKTNDYKLYVVKGIENCNAKTVFMASIRSIHEYGSVATGWFYTEFNEAKTEGLTLLDKMQLEYNDIQL